MIVFLVSFPYPTLAGKFVPFRFQSNPLASLMMCIERTFLRFGGLILASRKGDFGFGYGGGLSKEKRFKWGVNFIQMLANFDRWMGRVSLFPMIHSAAPQSRPVVIIVFKHVSVRPSVPTFQNKRRLKIMIATCSGLWVWPRGSLMPCISLRLANFHLRKERNNISFIVI